MKVEKKKVDYLPIDDFMCYGEVYLISVTIFLRMEVKLFLLQGGYYRVTDSLAYNQQQDIFSAIVFQILRSQDLWRLCCWKSHVFI